MINVFRKLLIRIGKVLPFFICFLVCIHYVETVFALATNDFLEYDDVVIPNTRLSFIVGKYFEYNAQTIVVLFVISISIKTCVYNKLACIYLGINLLEKSYFQFELYVEQIIMVALLNIIISTFLVFKGIKMVTH